MADTLDEAIAFAADEWSRWSRSGAVPANINVRDRLAFFAPPFKKALFAKFPALRVADDQVLLLIVAEGIARSRTDPRRQIEAALGIKLPGAG